MKKVIMASVVALSSVFAVTACTSVGATTDTTASTSMQKHHKGGMKDGGMRGPLTELNLSATQKAQIEAIRQNSQNERAQTREAIEAVLTAEQRAQLAEMKAERGDKTHKGHKGQHKKDGKDMGQQKAFSQLNLTNTLKAQIEAIRKDTNGTRAQKQQAVMAVLTPEQRAQLESLKSQRQNKR